MLSRHVYFFKAFFMFFWNIPEYKKLLEEFPKF